MNLSLADVGGALLVVSQFTLYGNAEKGRRPSFIDAARPEVAVPLYERFVALLQERGVQVPQGVLIYDLGDDTRRATGLAAGDVGFQVNRQRIGSAAELRAALAQAAGGQAITLWFERNGMIGRTSFYVQ